jgi:hypothetical protein
MGTDLLARGAALIAARWRRRLLLAALVIDMVLWGYDPAPALAGGAVVVPLLVLMCLRRRLRPRRPPWSPPWQAYGETSHRRRPHRMGSTGVRRVPMLRRRRQAVTIRAAAAILQALPARLRAHGWRWAQTMAALRAHLRRPAPIAPGLLPNMLAALTVATERALTEAGVVGEVNASESTPRAVALMLQISDLSPAQTRQIRTTLRVFAPALHWSGSPRLLVPLPLALSPEPTQAPCCVPILRRTNLGRVQTAPILWWPLRETHPLVLAGDALPTLLAMLETLAGLPGLLLYDPEQTLTAQTTAGDRWPAHTPDALAITCAHALRTAYRCTHLPDAPLPPPLTLVVAAPDAEAWRDLTPLLSRPGGGVRLILALTLGASHVAAQDACRRGHIVEIGALGHSDLPEACRPPGLAAPPAGMVLAWQTSHLVWRGAPIRRH